ncbi:hypothetical protein [Candidatus Nitronereus thalassa]|uniref:Uncharacterized protein n=1 Tax=Candidatus Nitronereus thalassa TaxID=3020898 RepID=A0ABU3K9B4_9BACT|nr:hypothetical protein [Candidatus Nitronereus thalassa]MDT7043002.1 hypothetical protein [Candidatus Nitronereus thalassa]
MAELSPNPAPDYGMISTLWQVHQDADWPVSGDTHEGELMTLDTVVAGCVTYFLEERELDAQRVGILQDCLADLESLMSDLDSEAQTYFERLQQLGGWILQSRART